jgi:hypothetical protein
MKKLLATVLLGGLGLFAAPAARAQSEAPDFPTAGKEVGTSETGARRNSRASSEELARNQRRANMSPEDVKRDQQLEILEARTGMGTGNTSFSRNGPERQFESAGGFKVRKFKAKAGSGLQKRGMTHMAGGADPKGQRLIDKKRRNKFLIF